MSDNRSVGSGGGKYDLGQALAMPDSAGGSTTDLTSPHELSQAGCSAQLVPQASLVVVRGALSGRVFPLTQNEYIVGRSHDADITIPERPVSSHHFLLRRMGDSHEIIDLGSTNGTSLNGRRLSANARIELHPGDTIQVGECSLVYLAEGMKDASDVTQALSMTAPNYAMAVATPAGGADEILAQILKLSAPPEPPPKVSLDERVEQAGNLLRRAKRHLPLVIAVGAVGALLGVGSIAVVPPMAEGMFIIALRPQASGNPLDPDRGQQDPNDYSFFISAESNFVAPKLVAETLRKLGVAQPTDEQIELTQKRLSFKSVAITTYAGSYKHPSPTEAVKFLRTHVENYLETEISKTLKVVQKQVDFLTEQSRDQEIQLRETEVKLKDFRSKYGELLPENSDGHMESLETLRQRQSDLSARVQGTRVAYQEALTEARRQAPSATIRTGSAAPYRVALENAKVELAAAQSRGLGDEHPEVVRLKRLVSEYTKLHGDALSRDASATETAGNQDIIALQHAVSTRNVEYRAAEAELGAVSGQIARLERIVKELPAVAAEYAQLSRSYGVNTETHRRLLEQLENAKVRLNLERASAEKRYEVVLEPRVYASGARKTLAIRAIAGSAIGAVLGAILAAVLWVRRWLKELPQRRAHAIATAGAAAATSAPRLPSPRRG